MNEYIVTCRSYEDLENLYDDMETPGGSLYIPDRAVDLVHRRTISRNTHYMLTEEEAEQVRNDPRVIGCERPAIERGLEPDYLWVQTGDFEKTTGALQSDDKNWGLYRIDRGDYYDQTPTTYTLTVGAISPDHFTITGSDRLYSYSNSNDPVLTISVYDTIVFNNPVSGAHPLEIRSSLGGSSTSFQVNNPPASGQRTSTVTWTPTTAGSYYYQCPNHPNMNGGIVVNARTKTWGSDSSTTELSNKTIVTTASGKNVDVVIVDGHINPNHPEFAVNVDGTGGSRVNQFNWFQYSSALGYSTAATYTYSTSGSSPNTNHGTHVAGTACGNTQGWARDANIYNMAFSDSLSGVSSWAEKLWDYLRHFHLNKPINPATGRRNPTITNNSWGYNQGSTYMTNVSSVNYRGTNVNITGTTSQIQALLEANGHPPGYEDDYGNKWFARIPGRSTAVDADLQDAINDGVIVIAAAGNSYFNSDVPTGLDYNNYMTISNNNYYASRGMSPAAADNVIAVGSLGSLQNEYKSNFSQWGANIDIWAPGSDIISAVYDASSAAYEQYGDSSSNTLPTDPRNSSYYLASINGTSMASPQVCGVIACLAEQEPDMTQEDARTHLIENAASNIGSTGSDNVEPYHALGSTSFNRYLTMPKKRPASGTLSPAVRHKNRNSDSSGVKFPRVRNNRVFK